MIIIDTIQTLLRARRERKQQAIDAIATEINLKKYSEWQYFKAYSESGLYYNRKKCITYFPSSNKIKYYDATNDKQHTFGVDRRIFDIDTIDSLNKITGEVMAKFTIDKLKRDTGQVITKDKPVKRNKTQKRVKKLVQSKKDELSKLKQSYKLNTTTKVEYIERLAWLQRDIKSLKNIL